jgi:hypothetical protein
VNPWADVDAWRKRHLPVVHCAVSAPAKRSCCWDKGYLPQQDKARVAPYKSLHDLLKRSEYAKAQVTLDGEYLLVSGRVPVPGMFAHHASAYAVRIHKNAVQRGAPAEEDSP